MAMTAAEIIDEAREFHVFFNPEIHPDTMLLRALHRAEARFYDVISNIAPDALALDHVYDADDIAAGILGTALTIPVYKMLLPTGVLVNPQGIFPVSLAEDEQSKGGSELFIRIVGRLLYIAQPTAFQAEMPGSVSQTIQNYSYFKEATGLRISYVPLPEPIPTLASTLISPDDARRFLQTELVKFMAMRDPGIIADRNHLLAEVAMIQEEVIEQYANRSGAETRWYVSDVG